MTMVISSGLERYIARLPREAAHTWAWGLFRASRKGLGEDVFYSTQPSGMSDGPTGVGPSEMFENMRLEKAAHDLRYGRKHTDISLDCGFSQPRHLATAFRRRFGLTPTEYLQKAAS